LGASGVAQSYRRAEHILAWPDRQRGADDGFDGKSTRQSLAIDPSFLSVMCIPLMLPAPRL
jgi:hypothetical protein